jgi:hypothetical protein
MLNLPGGFNNPLTNIDPTGMYVCSDGKDGACTADQDKALEKSLNVGRQRAPLTKRA